MVKHRKSKKNQKGGFVSSIFRGIVNATGGVKMKDGTKRKINPKFSPYRPNEPWLLPARRKQRQKGGRWLAELLMKKFKPPKKYQKGGTAVPDYNYTNTHGWRGWGNHWWGRGQMGMGKQKGGWTQEYYNSRRRRARRMWGHI